jgi:hypothetical protein
LSEKEGRFFEPFGILEIKGFIIYSHKDSKARRLMWINYVLIGKKIIGSRKAAKAQNL